MSPKAASYFRHRPFLTPERCRQWRVGYLPRDTGGDHAGGTMRGKIVYPMLSEDGEVLTWFGRDPEYEGKHHEWIVGGKQGKEPEKYHFVKGFERGLELFGQHRLREEDCRKRVAGMGLVVVQGPNDVIALDALGVPAVGLCATTITRSRWRRSRGSPRRVAAGRDGDARLHGGRRTGRAGGRRGTGAGLPGATGMVGDDARRGIQGRRWRRSRRRNGITFARSSRERAGGRES